MKITSEESKRTRSWSSSRRSRLSVPWHELVLRKRELSLLEWRLRWMVLIWHLEIKLRWCLLALLTTRTRTLSASLTQTWLRVRLSSASSSQLRPCIWSIRSSDRRQLKAQSVLITQKWSTSSKSVNLKSVTSITLSSPIRSTHEQLAITQMMIQMRAILTSRIVKTSRTNSFWKDCIRLLRRILTQMVEVTILKSTLLMKMTTNSPSSAASTNPFSTCTESKKTKLLETKWTTTPGSDSRNIKRDSEKYWCSRPRRTFSKRWSSSRQLWMLKTRTVPTKCTSGRSANLSLRL